jgi:putative sugar O-methyltransferase
MIPGGIHKYQYIHVDVCKQSIENKELYANFKRQESYVGILQHCPLNIAEKCAEKISNFPVFNKLPWLDIQFNDLIGNPETHSFESHLKNIKLDSYQFSTTTILYLYQAINILSNFPLKNLNIVEVGPGYGGLLYIIKVIAPIFNKNITKYAIIDLPDVSTHQQKYLSDMQKINPKFSTQNIEYIKSDNVTTYGANLFISIYALGELPPEIATFYINNISILSDYYYIWWNLTNIHPHYTSNNSKIEKTGLDIRGLDLIVSNF